MAAGTASALPATVPLLWGLLLFAADVATIERRPLGKQSAPSIELDGEQCFSRGLPALSADGTRIALAYSGEDGARGEGGLSLILLDVATDRIADEIIIVPAARVVPEPVIRRRIARANQVLAKSAWVPLSRYFASIARDVRQTGISHARVERLRLTFREPRLRVRDPDRLVLDRNLPSWSAPKADCAVGCKNDWSECCCHNAAYISEVFADADRTVLLVAVSFLGSDACWEPDSRYHVLVVPNGAR